MLLDKSSKNEIMEAIRAAEKLTSGEIRVHLKSKCGENALEDAKKIFHKLRMHRAKEKNAVLIFVAVESRKFAIFGDEGIHVHAGQDYWHATRDVMAAYFSKGQLKEGIIAGVQSVGEKLKQHFPKKDINLNELSDNITEG